MRVQWTATATGRYEWTMTVTLEYDSAPDEVHEFTGWQSVFNRSDSDFGAGWWLDALDRLHVQSGEGVLLVNGDGSSFWFAENGSGYDLARGDETFSALTQNGGVYTLTDKWGNYRTFDASNGWITSVGRPNSVAADFSYSYVSGKLDQIDDISGRTHSFSYDENGHLDEVIDFAGRGTTVTVSAGGLLTSVIVADEPASPTNFYANYVAPEWTFGYLQVDADHIYLNSVTDPADAATTYQYNLETYRLSKMIHADLTEWTLIPALTEGFVTPGAKTLYLLRAELSSQFEMTRRLYMRPSQFQIRQRKTSR